MMKFSLRCILLIGLFSILASSAQGHLSNEQEQEHPDESNQHHQQQPPSNIQQMSDANTHIHLQQDQQQQQQEQLAQRAQHQEQAQQQQPEQHQHVEQQIQRHDLLPHLVAPHFVPEPITSHPDGLTSSLAHQENSNHGQQSSPVPVQFHDIGPIGQRPTKPLGSSNNAQQSNQQGPQEQQVAAGQQLQQGQQVVKIHEQHHQLANSDVHTTSPHDSRAQSVASNQQQSMLLQMQPQQQMSKPAQSMSQQQTNQIQQAQQQVSLAPMQSFSNSQQIQSAPMAPYQQQQQASSQSPQISAPSQQQSIRRTQMQKTQPNGPLQSNQQQQLSNMQQTQQQPTIVMNQQQQQQQQSQQQQQYQAIQSNQQQQQQQPRQQSTIMQQQAPSEPISLMQTQMVSSASQFSQLLQNQQQQQQQQQVMVSKYQPSLVSPLYLGHNPFIEILRPLSYADDNIVTLNLSHSHIYEIDSDAFVGQRFEHIDLSNNKLGLIHSRSFRIGPSHSRHTPFSPSLGHGSGGQSGLGGALGAGPLVGANSSKFSVQQQHYVARRPPPAHPKSVTIDFSHNPAIVALSGAFDHIDVPNCLLNFTNSTVELKFGAFKKYFKEHPGHIIDIDTVDCCDQEWLLGYKHNFVARTHCAHDPNLYLLKVSQQTIIDSCIAYVTSARHNLIMPSSGIIQSAAANGPRHSASSHQDNQQYLTYLILGGTAMILTSLSIYIIFYMFSLKAAFVYSMQTQKS